MAHFRTSFEPVLGTFLEPFGVALRALLFERNIRKTKRFGAFQRLVSFPFWLPFGAHSRAHAGFLLDYHLAEACVIPDPGSEPNLGGGQD